MIGKMERPDLAVGLFGNWQETMIWSCLQGVMGRIYAAPAPSPASAMAVLGDFCFFAGQPNSELVRFYVDDHPLSFVIMVPQNQDWAALIEETYGDKARKIVRYATKKERNVFDSAALKRIVKSLPAGHALHRIDENLYQQCKRTAWCRDFVAQYPTYADYQALGMGWVICKDGCIVSGASSYSSYRGGIEIEIDTHRNFRRRGLALVCGARLILDCLEHNRYPSWDAQNKASLALAQKLGYHFDHEYPVYEIYGVNAQ